ncbi:MAG: hypothetical protein GY845_28715 [Planctomycetes bacterium]|nr:hypothetical protein [Planctomycetota bacterium]
MKKGAVLLTVVFIFGLLGSIVACSSNNDNEKLVEKTWPNAVELMKKVPDTWVSFTFVDFDEYRKLDTSGESEEVSQSIEQYIGNPFVNPVTGKRVEFDMANQAHKCISGEYGIYTPMLVEADFVIDDLSQKLDAVFIDGKEQHGGIDIWSIWGEKKVALVDNFIIHGTKEGVISIINVINNGARSLYRDDDYKDMLDILPGGFMVSCAKGTILYPYYENSVVSGATTSVRYGESRVLTQLYKFENEDDYDDVLFAIKKVHWKVYAAFDDVSTTQNGKYIELIAEKEEESIPYL